MQLLPALLERFDLGRLVTTYPLADHATALAVLFDDLVMRILRSRSRPSAAA